MKYRFLSAILKDTWAIEYDTAIKFSPIIANILNHQKPQTVIIDSQDGYINIAERLTQSSNSPFIITSQNKTVKGLKDTLENSVAVIPVIGPLMKYDQEDMELCETIAGMQTIGKWIEQASFDKNIRSIILNIDTPGGTVDGTEYLANIIKNVSKPIVAYVSGMAASAGYWLASQTKEIIASSQTDVIGSIGVMLSFADMQPVFEQMGVKFHHITSDQSPDKNKTFLDIQQGNYESIKKKSLNPIADIFINTIKENRVNIKPEQLTGETFLAKHVIGSMIDYIGNFEYAIERARKLSEKNYTIY